MSIELVDFSWARPGGAALVKAGKHGVVRYVPYRGDGGKGLTKAEVADYRAHGLAICLVWETIGGRARQGRAAGQNDANIARLAAHDLGFPAGIPIYFAVDWNAKPAEWPAIDDYLGGAAAVLGLARVGVYGHARLMAHCARAKSASWFWQTYAWSAGAVYPGAHLLQYQNHALNINGALDLTRALKPDYGQWDPPTVVGPVVPTKPPNLPPTDTGPQPKVVASAPTPTERNVMIPQGGISVSSSHVMRLARGQPLFGSPGGPRVTAMSKAGSVPYVGTAGKGWRAVIVATGAPYKDHKTRRTVVYVPADAGPVEAGA